MKRFLSIFIAIIIIISMMPNTSFGIATEGPYLILENTEIPVLASGKENTIKLTLKNTGGATAESLVMTPIFSDKTTFTLNNLTTTTNLKDINSNGSMPIDLKLSVANDAAPGNYPVTLKFDYKYTEVVLGDGGTKIISVSTINESKELTIYVRIDSKNTTPKLLVSSIKTNPDIINPGQNAKLTINFENKGTLDAKDISVNLIGLKNDGGFFLSSGSDIGFISKVAGNGNSSISFNLKAAPNIKKGAHELKVTFSYNGQSQTEPQTIYVNVGGDSSQASNLLLENISYPTTAVKANNNFVLKFDLRNNGGVNAKDVLVKVESSDPTIIPKTTSIKKISTIAVAGKESLQFIFSPTEEAITKNYPLEITIKYTDDLGEENIINQYVGVYVDNPGGSTGSQKGKPKLIIDKYSFEPQLARAGENFEMTLSFYNTSSNKTVKNIKIFLTAEAGSTNDSPGAGSSAFTPVDSSNTFYIDSIPPRGKIEKTITMFTIPDAIAKTHTITANFEYEDNEGNELKDIELIGVPVVQNSRLETGELSYYPEAMIGQPMPISLEFYNTGKVTLYNMMVKLEGDFQTENGSTYIGNFITGSSEYFEGMVVPSEPGELKGAVLFTYEDSTGQMQELRKEFTLNVMEMPPMEEYPGDFYPPMEEGNGGFKGILKSKWLWITLVSIIVIVGGVMFYKKKKKAKEMAFDE